MTTKRNTQKKRIHISKFKFITILHFNNSDVIEPYM
jgi:hypothetical protein